MENKYISYAEYVSALIEAIKNKESIYSRKREGKILEALLETKFVGCDIVSWDPVYPHCDGYYDITKLDFNNYVYVSEKMLFKENYNNIEKEVLKQFDIMKTTYRKLEKFESILNKYYDIELEIDFENINFKYRNPFISKEAE